MTLYSQIRLASNQTGEQDIQSVKLEIRNEGMVEVSHSGGYLCREEVIKCSKQSLVISNLGSCEIKNKLL